MLVLQMDGSEKWSVSLSVHISTLGRQTAKKRGEDLRTNSQKNIAVRELTNLQRPAVIERSKACLVPIDY